MFTRLGRDLVSLYGGRRSSPTFHSPNVSYFSKQHSNSQKRQQIELTAFFRFDITIIGFATNLHVDSGMAV